MKIHDLLDLPPDSTEKEIRKKYKFTCPHPDRNGSVEDFQIWNQAFQEWEDSLTEETPVQKYLRLQTNLIMQKGIVQDFVVQLQLVLYTNLTKLEQKKNQITEHKESFEEALIDIKKRIKNPDAQKTMINEIQKQIDTFPDIIAFMNDEISTIKQAIEITGKHSPKQHRTQTYRIM